MCNCIHTLFDQPLQHLQLVRSLMVIPSTQTRHSSRNMPSSTSCSGSLKAFRRVLFTLRHPRKRVQTPLGHHGKRFLGILVQQHLPVPLEKVNRRPTGRSPRRSPAPAPSAHSATEYSRLNRSPPGSSQPSDTCPPSVAPSRCLQTSPVG